MNRQHVTCFPLHTTWHRARMLAKAYGIISKYYICGNCFGGVINSTLGSVWWEEVRADACSLWHDIEASIFFPLGQGRKLMKAGSLYLSVKVNTSADPSDGRNAT